MNTRITFTLVVCLSMEVGSFPFPIIKPTNPYYVSKTGSAQLTNGETITGKFYYHRNPFKDGDSFYFYPSDIKSLQIIPITEMKFVEFNAKTNKKIRFNLSGRKLVRSLTNGKTQTLTTRFLRTL